MKKTNSKPVKKTPGKYVTEVTFEKSMVGIARSFAKVDEQFDKVDERFNKVEERLDKHDKLFEVIIGELQVIRQTTEDTQKIMSSYARDVAIHDLKIDDLTERVEMLESKAV